MATNDDSAAIAAELPGSPPTPGSGSAPDAEHKR